MSTTRVVVIGGGYAGVLAANRLTQRRDIDITLVNPRDHFTERMRLHQEVASTGKAAVGFGRVVAPDVRIVVDTATRIDAGARRVLLASGEALDYDFLVYAPGSRGAAPRVAGGEHARTMATFEEARRLRARLETTPLASALVVVGAGITGVETAAELAERGRPVTLVCGRTLGPYLHDRARSAVAGRLARLGVTIVAGEGATAVEVSPDAVRLADGRELASSVTIWTAGFEVPDLASHSGLATDATGRLLTDEALTGVSDERIVGAGDAVAPSGLPYRMSAYAAQPLGAHAADSILARLDGREPQPLRLGFFGLCVGLGRRSATLQVARTDDTATRATLSGRLVALVVKEGGTRGVLGQLTREARRPGSFRILRTDATRDDRIRTALAERRRSGEETT